MELFSQLKFDWIGKRVIFYFFSLALILIGVFAFIKNKGPKLGVEFTGGTLLQIGFNELPPVDKIREALSADGWDGFSLQTQPSDKNIIIRTKLEDRSKDDVGTSLISSLKKVFSGNVKELPDRVEYVGPVVGKQLFKNAIFAILGSMGMIILYVAFRFKNWIWGLAGVLALVHDVFITWGFLTLSGRETTLVIIAALLTIAGYSINDTIVIFDRVRENLRTSRKESTQEIYNRSINETMARTINTSFTALLASLSLLFFGGQVIFDFALAMTFGIVIGSYSTIGVAIGMVYGLEQRQKNKK
ncbi:MAG: protein translocase subunit SecF [Elusimicrobiota bacterium]